MCVFSSQPHCLKQICSYPFFLTLWTGISFSRLNAFWPNLYNGITYTKLFIWFTLKVTGQWPKYMSDPKWGQNRNYNYSEINIRGTSYFLCGEETHCFGSYVIVTSERSKCGQKCSINTICACRSWSRFGRKCFSVFW